MRRPVSVSRLLGIQLVAASAVAETLQGSAGADAATGSRVCVNASTNESAIHRTATATPAVKVAWHSFG